MTLEAVSELLDRLLARLARCHLKPLIRLGRTIRKHREGILVAGGQVPERLAEL